MKLWLLILVGLLFFAVLLYNIAATAQSHQISFETYLSVMLTATGVMLGALAIGTGIAAIWGYQQIKSEAKNAADEAVNKYVNKFLAEQNIQGMIVAAVTREGDQLYEDLNATMPTAAEEASESVADAYPDEHPEEE